MKRKTHIKPERKDTIKLIVKANELVEARYMFNSWETRFFNTLITLLGKDDSGDDVYRIWFKDIKNDYAINSNKSYELLREAARSLRSKSVYVGWANDAFRRGREYSLFEFVDYLEPDQSGPGIEQQEYVDVKIGTEIRPLLLGLKEKFTSYDSRNVQKLKPYATRIYELLKQFEFKGFRTLRVGDLKAMFLIEKEYSKFSTFNQSVIKPSIIAINKHTDLFIDPKQIKKIKKGRRVDALQFTIKGKTKTEMNKIRKIAQPTPVIEETVNSGVGEELGLEDDQKQILDLVKNWGITKETLAGYFERRSMDHILTCVSITQGKKNIKDKGAYLVSLLKKEQVINSQKTVTVQDDEKRAKAKKLEALDLWYKKKLDELKQSKNRRQQIIISTLLKEDPEFVDFIKNAIPSGRFFNYNDALSFEENYKAHPMNKGLVNSKIVALRPELFEILDTLFDKKIKALDAELEQKRKLI